MRIFDIGQQAYAPLTPEKTFRMYVCGITPYDSAHLGHIFTFMTYDLLQRYLEDQGVKVQMVRNITDVDEPIYKRAAQMGISCDQLAEQETAEFQMVLKQLNFRPAHAEPRASQYVTQTARAVKQLFDSGYGYYVDQDIYFDTSKVTEFGTFSGFNNRIKMAFMQERGGDPKRPEKLHPFDFLLWKNIDDPKDAAAWDTVLGHGRPGWHIECSVMASELLGIPFDLHGGGTDLIFPHHECEIAQSVGLGHGVVAKNWLHVSPMIMYGEKMSKSLGNLVFAKDLLKIHEPAVIRLALMRYHYRSGGEWRPELLEDASELWAQLQVAFYEADNASLSWLHKEICKAMADDLDTPEIIYALKEFIALPKDKQKAASALIRSVYELLGLTKS